MSQESNNTLEELLQFVRVSSLEQPVTTLVQRIADTAIRLTGADHASVRVMDEKEELVALARAGVDVQWTTPVPLRSGQGVLGWVVSTGTAALVPNVLADRRFTELAGQGFDIGAVVAAPIISASRVVGVLSISSKRVEAFNEWHRDVLKLLAAVATPYIEVARREQA